MARRLLWGLIPLGLEFNEELIYGRRGTSLLEDRDANGSGRDGCIEADDMGFVKCSFFLPTVQWLDKEISVKVLKWANTFTSVSSAKQNPRLSLAAETEKTSLGASLSGEAGSLTADPPCTDIGLRADA